MAHKQAQYTHMDVSCELSYELYRDGLATGGITTVRWVRSTSESTRSRVCVRQGAIRAAGGGSFREPPCQVNFANQAFTTIYSIYCQTFYMGENMLFAFPKVPVRFKESERYTFTPLTDRTQTLWQKAPQNWILNSKFYFALRYGRYSWGGNKRFILH